MLGMLPETTRLSVPPRPEMGLVEKEGQGEGTEGRGAVVLRVAPAGGLKVFSPSGLLPLVILLADRHDIDLAACRVPWVEPQCRAGARESDAGGFIWIQSEVVEIGNHFLRHVNLAMDYVGRAV